MTGDWEKENELDIMKLRKSLVLGINSGRLVFISHGLRSGQSTQTEVHPAALNKMSIKKFYFFSQIFVWLMLICFHLELGVSAYRENILLIVADDLRPSVGVYGDPEAVTPNIDGFASSGVTFVQAYAQQALCAPSRNSFLTSRRPDTLHLYDFYSYWRTFAGNFTTLPQYFKENDYYTKSIGKIFHPGKSSNYTDDYPYSWSELPWHPSTEKFKNAPVCMTGSKLYANLVCPVRVSDQPEGTLPDIQSLEEAIRFLESRQNHVQSFFLAVGFHKPHIPLKFPKEYLDYHPIRNVSLPTVRNYPPSLPTIAWNPWNDIRKRDDIATLNVSFPFSSIPDDWVKKIRQAYFSSVTYIDDLIGRLLVGLETYELHKNTIVVLLGDHGWSLGEHGEWSKYSNLDIATRVPLIFNAPSIFKEGNKIWDPVELVDLFPTLVDLVGLKAIPKCPKNSSDIMLCTEGKSLAPYILGEIDSSNELEQNMYVKGKYSLSQYPRPGVEPTKTPDSDKPHMKDIKFMGYSIRTPRHRYTQWISWDSETLAGNWTDVNQTELYDHRIDPDENLNLAGRPGLEELEADLSELLREGFSN